MRGECFVLVSARYRGRRSSKVLFVCLGGVVCLFVVFLHSSKKIYGALGTNWSSACKNETSCFGILFIEILRGSVFAVTPQARLVYISCTHGQKIIFNPLQPNSWIRVGTIGNWTPLGSEVIWPTLRPPVHVSPGSGTKQDFRLSPFWCGKCPFDEG